MTAADAFEYVISILICKRTLEESGEKNDPILLANPRPKIWVRGKPNPKKKTMVSQVLKLVEGISPGHHFVLDSLYGGIDLVEALRDLGHFATVSAKSTRPSFLFKENLSKESFKHFAAFSEVHGILQGQTKAPFVACAFQVILF